MGSVIEARAVILGEDKTGAAFSSVERRATALDRALKRLSSTWQSAGRAQQASERAFADGGAYEGRLRAIKNLTRQTERLAQASRAAEQAMVGPTRAQRALSTARDVGSVGAGMLGLRHVGGAIAGLSAFEAGKFVYRTRAALLHERVRMSTSGMSDQEIAEAERHALDLSTRNKAFNSTTIAHMLRNARSVVGSYEEASHIIEPMLKLRTVALGAHPQKADELNEDFDKLIKGMEIKGVTQNMPQFMKYMDGMARAINVFGDTLRPTDYYEMFKYGRQATNALSEKFMLKTAPTLAQELGGSSTGQALSTFYQTLIGGRMKDVAAKELEKFGLLDPSKVIRTKTGAVKGVSPGGVIESRLAASDPYEWVNKVFLPALARHGVTDKDKIQDIIAATFRDRTAAQLVSILASQQSRIDKDARLVDHAQGLDAAKTIQENDPFVAWKSVAAQLESLINAYHGFEKTAQVLNRVADILAEWTKAKQDADKKPSDQMLPPSALNKMNGWLGTPSAETVANARIAFGAAGEDDRRVAILEDLRRRSEERKKKLEKERDDADRHADAIHRHPAANLPAMQAREEEFRKKAAAARAALAQIEATHGAVEKAASDLDALEKRRRSFESLRINRPQEFPQDWSPGVGGSRMFGFGPGGYVPDGRQGGYAADGQWMPNIPHPPSRPPELGGATPGGPAPQQISSLKDILGGGAVEARLTGSAEVSGNVEAKIIVQPGSALIAIQDGVQRLSAQVKGALNTSGLGSKGTSMPQYASPSPGQ